MHFFIGGGVVLAISFTGCVFNFSFLALLLSEILGGTQIYIRGPCATQRPLA